MRPGQRFAVDVFLEQAFAHHEGEGPLGATPWAVGLLVDDVAQIVEAARRAGFAVVEPFLAGLAAFPGFGGEAEDFDFHAAAFERAGEDVGATGGDHDWAATHRA